MTLLPHTFYQVQSSAIIASCREHRNVDTSSCILHSVLQRMSLEELLCNSNSRKPKNPYKTCVSATLSTANLCQCHSVHHKHVPVPLYPSQTCPSATLSTAILCQCHSVHSKPAPVPLCPPQTCASATLSTTIIAWTGLGLNPDLCI